MGESASQDHVKRVERELAKEESLLDKMIEQAPGMIGMALMFITTILIGIWLQPWFNSAGLQAFGEAGSTQARWIVLELVAIFAFTFAILWLAKNHLQHVIKYGLLFVLFLALCYTTVPGAHILLVPEIETEAFVFTEESEINEEVVSVNSDGSMITQIEKWTDNNSNHTFVVSKRSSDTALEWSHELEPFPGTPNFRSMEGDYAYTITNDAWIWSLDKDSGSVLSKYACFDLENWNGTWENASEDLQIRGCLTALEVIEDPNAEPGEKKGALYITNGGNELIRRNTFQDVWVETSYAENIGKHSHQARWSFPQLQLNEEIFESRQYDEDSLLFASPIGAAIILMEETSDAYPGPETFAPNGWIDPCELEWIYSSDSTNNLTAFNIVDSPWDADEKLAMVGLRDGEVSAWIVDDDIDEFFDEETRLHGDDVFEGPIAAIENFDLSEDGNNELWIADADGIHGLFGSGLSERVTLDVSLEEDSIVRYSDSKIKTISVGSWVDENNFTLTSMDVMEGEFDPDNMYNVYGIQWDDTAFFVGIGLAVLLMVALIVRPEWYVVNTVGVLVGAGVIVMLGVTFVPTLIVIFMILAAIYDAWAVYRSKHMLDLADTMIGLNLPILLVAPQESGYTMLDEKESIRPPEDTAQVAPSGNSVPMVKVKRKKPKEAMFMGLGDVIFPGMLVISCVDSIVNGGLAVGISALIGGLVGYLVLMAYVASGKPQAGLPLLNGGAILGYLIGGLIFVGSAAFSFGISF